MIAAKCPKCGNIGCTGILCGYKTIHENAVNINPFSVEEQVKQQLEEFKRKVLDLNRWQDTYDMMEVQKDGDYVLLSDVLNLFSEKKD